MDYKIQIKSMDDMTASELAQVKKVKKHAFPELRGLTDITDNSQDIILAKDSKDKILAFIKYGQTHDRHDYYSDQEKNIISIALVAVDDRKEIRQKGIAFEMLNVLKQKYPNHKMELLSEVFNFKDYDPMNNNKIRTSKQFNLYFKSGFLFKSYLDNNWAYLERPVMNDAFINGLFLEQYFDCNKDEINDNSYIDIITRKFDMMYMFELEEKQITDSLLNNINLPIAVMFLNQALVNKKEILKQLNLTYCYENMDKNPLLKYQIDYALAKYVLDAANPKITTKDNSALLSKLVNYKNEVFKNAQIVDGKFNKVPNKYDHYDQFYEIIKTIANVKKDRFLYEQNYKMEQIQCELNAKRYSQQTNQNNVDNGSIYVNNTENKSVFVNNTDSKNNDDTIKNVQGKNNLDDIIQSDKVQ